MIPYDDLVAALSAWRARQGLPVNDVGGSGPHASPGSGPYASPGSGPYATPGSGPHGTPGSGPNRPPPPPDEPLEVADDAMVEDAYDNEGSDYAMSFGGQASAGDGDDATAIGEAPERPTESDMRNNRDDW